MATGVFQNRGRPHGPALDFLVLRCCDASQALALLRYVAGAWSGVGRAPRGKPLGLSLRTAIFPRASLGSVSSQKSLRCDVSDYYLLLVHVAFCTVVCSSAVVPRFCI